MRPGCTRGRQPAGDFRPPQIESKRLELRKQDRKQVTQRMRPARPGIVDNDQLAARFEDAEHLAQRSLAPLARLLVEQKEHKRPIIAGIGQLEVHCIHCQQS
jgi:hypothetical protein